MIRPGRLCGERIRGVKGILGWVTYTKSTSTGLSNWPFTTRGTIIIKKIRPCRKAICSSSFCEQAITLSKQQIKSSKSVVLPICVITCLSTHKNIIYFSIKSGKRIALRISAGTRWSSLPVGICKGISGKRSVGKGARERICGVQGILGRVA